MAGHVRYTALLDACVLYPLAMTDALISLATAGLYAAKWTARIEQEWIRSLERQLSNEVVSHPMPAEQAMVKRLFDHLQYSHDFWRQQGSLTV